jgi:flagellar hook-associated protein 1 FlgK
MSDIYGIAKSGLQAYKERLAVTGQNIANVGNDGYARREAVIGEVKSSSADVLQLSQNTSFGVKIDGITRAFDQFITTQLHSAQSNFSFSESQTLILNKIEELMLPKTGGVGAAINDFFGALNTASQDASDIAARSVAIDAANTLGYSISSLAAGANNLRSQVGQNLKDYVGSVNNILAELSKVQHELSGLSSEKTASKGLLDQRDSLVKKLSELIDVDVQYRSGGKIEIRSGISHQEIVILSDTSHKYFSLDTLNGNPRVFISPSPNSTGVKLSVRSGEIAGAIAADNTLVEVKSSLDTLAKKIVSEFNQIHSQGADLDGQKGGELFSLDSLEIQKTSRSDSSTELRVLGDFEHMLGDELNVRFDAASSNWQLLNSESSLLGEFSGSFEYSGLEFQLSGRPALGDTFNINFSDNLAENMMTKITDPKELAASSRYLVEQAPENVGTASFSVREFEPVNNLSEPKLNEYFLDLKNSANSVQFRSPGLLGVLDNADSLNDFAVLKKQDKLQFSLSVSELDQNSSMRLNLDGSLHEFQLGTNIEKVTSWGELADLLNSGSIKSTTTSPGMSFRELGLKAGAAGNTLVVASAANSRTGSLSSLEAGSIDSASGLLVSGVDEPTQIQIFTKEGIHLAGSPLSPEQSALLVSPTNGFSAGAVYNAQHLNGADTGSYVDANISRVTASGDHVVNISTGGNFSDGGSHLLTGVGSAPLTRDDPDQTIEVTFTNGTSVIIHEDSSMMSGHLASAINNNASNLGLLASASNALELYKISDGTVSFDLKGDNAGVIPIEASVQSGDTSALASEINKHVDSTNVEAFSAYDGSIVLKNRYGNDISISGLEVSSGAVSARQLDIFGEVIGGSNATGIATLQTGDFVVSRGQLVLQSAIGFEVSNQDDRSASSSVSEFTNGFVSKDFNHSTGVQRVVFDTNALVDGGHLSLNNLNPVAESSSYSLSISSDIGLSHTISASLEGLSSDALDSKNLAEELSSRLRQQAPQTAFLGADFSLLDGFPKNGDNLEFRLGEELYKATITSIPEYSVAGQTALIDGQSYSLETALEKLVSEANFVVSGNEENRIQVGFSKTENGDGFRLYAVARDGILSGQNLSLSTSNTVENLNAFNVGGNETVSVLYGGSLKTDVATETLALLKIGSSLYNVGLDENANVSLVHSEDSSVPTGVTVSIEELSSGDRRLKVEVDHSLLNEDIRLQSSAGSADYGVLTSSSQLSVDSNSGIQILNLADARVSSSASVKSLADEIFNIDNMGGEDLIIIATGSSNPNLLGSVGDHSSSSSQRDITVEVGSVAENRLDFFDTSTGDFLGSRNHGGLGEVSFGGFYWEFSGALSEGDKFTLTTNSNRQDDASNLSRFLQLAQVSEATGMGGYSDFYNEITVELGFSAKAAEQGLVTSKAIFDAALDREAAFSGVDLDTEAARLLEQQQAYQALAKVLSTAQELVDTLLRSM